MEEDFDLDKFVTRLKTGEKVKCPVCGSGYVVPVINGYACDHCEAKLNEN